MHVAVCSWLLVSVIISQQWNYGLCVYTGSIIANVVQLCTAVLSHTSSSTRDSFVSGISTYCTYVQKVTTVAVCMCLSIAIECRVVKL